MISLTALTACNTANNTSSKASIASSYPETFDAHDIINNRFKEASKAFSGNETSDINAINNGSNRYPSDSPGNSNSFKKPADGTSEMICYRSDTGRIVIADSPNKLGIEYNRDLADKINTALKTDADGKVVIYRTALRPDFTDAGKQIPKRVMTVAWSGFALSGNKNSKLVCTISAPVPNSQ